MFNLGEEVTNFGINCAYHKKRGCSKKCPSCRWYIGDGLQHISPFEQKLFQHYCDREADKLARKQVIQCVVWLIVGAFITMVLVAIFRAPML